MKLIWNGHACFTLYTGKDLLVFDPYSPGSVPGWSLPQLRANAVFCSHEHRDHNYKEGVLITEKAPSYTVRRIPTFHDNTGGRERGCNLITVIEAEGLSIAHFGDIGHLLTQEQLSAVGKVDIAMLPVGGCYTIGAEEARKLADSTGAKVVIPMHYRGSGFGYDVLTPVDDFLALYAQQEICLLPSPEWEFSAELTKSVIVFG